MRILLFLSLSVTACAASQTNVADLKRLQTQVDQLQARLARNEAAASDLRNDLMMLQQTRAPVSEEKVELPSIDAAGLPVIKLRAEPIVDPALPEEAPVEIVSGENGEVHHLSKQRPNEKASQAFRKALSLYQKGKIQQAFEQLAAFLQRNPEHPDAETARFWMGECKYDQKQYKAAIELFENFRMHAPRHIKAADALLKVGLSFERLNVRDKARENFAQLVRTYPHSAAADLARARLNGGASQ